MKLKGSFVLKIAISACLLGKNVTWRGDHNLHLKVKEIVERYDPLLICPEVMGGLPISRSPSEIISSSPLLIKNKDGKDVTHEFYDGAMKCLKLLKAENVKIAILKANSPSCGNEKIYDGSFSHQLIEGQGVLVQLLKKEGIIVFNENQVEDMLEYIGKEEKKWDIF